MPDRLSYPPPFMDIATLALHICAGESTIEGWIREGLFPPPKKIKGKRLWRWKDVERHLAGDEIQLPVDDTLARITDATRRAAQGH